MLPPMKLTIEITDNKLPFILELLKNFNFVNTVKIEEETVYTLSKVQQIAIEEAIEELNRGEIIDNDAVLKLTHEKFPNLF
jgi:hypothetical protein